MARFEIYGADEDPIDVVVCAEDVIEQLLAPGLVAVRIGDDRPLTVVRAEAIAAVNGTVAAIRRRYITDISGQEMLYLQKRDEARAYMAAWSPEADPDTADYPLIEAEVGVTAPSAYELAQLWLNLSALYVAVAASLETARLTAVYAIEAAADAAEMATARAAFDVTLTPP